MTPKYTLLGIGLALLTMISSLRADTAGYAAILKERDAVLSKIVTETENRLSSGAGDDEAVTFSKLALYTFRRDAASTSSQKIQIQKDIVLLQEMRLGKLKAQATSGIGDPLEVLRATDALLAAKQTLEEVQLKEKKG